MLLRQSSSSLTNLKISNIWSEENRRLGKACIESEKIMVDLENAAVESEILDAGLRKAAVDVGSGNVPVS